MAVILNQIGALAYLTAENIRAAHCFTTRAGGVSRGHLASMNIGTHRHDAPENVEQNYRILANAIGFSPQKLVLTKQTHTDIVRVVGKQQWGAGLFAPELSVCDALVTNDPGTALVAFTADCTPILLHDPVTGAVGAVHAGWRGTASAIVAKAVEKMVQAFGCRPQDIHAAIGPNIGVCCFETDREVPEAMVRCVGPEAWDHVQTNGRKYYVNLKTLNELLLRRAGVTDIAVCAACTACQSDRFWSHRKTGDRRGSQGAIIVCEEAGL